MQHLKILVVEDDKLIAKDICHLLEDWNYEIVGTVTNASDAILFFEEKQPDLMIIDINIAGCTDGISLAQQFNKICRKPFIFLTGQTDYHTIERAKACLPSAYLLKPFDEQTLHISIDMALNYFYNTNNNALEKEEKSLIINDINLKADNFLRKGDTVFIKNNYRFVKVCISDILHMEADGNHTKISTKGQKFIVRLPLATAVERLAAPNIVRIHRSFAINTTHVDEFDDAEVVIQKKSIPMSNAYRGHFLNIFNVF